MKTNDHIWLVALTITVTIIYSDMENHRKTIGIIGYWLVVWNMNFMTFPSYSWNVIIPTDFHSMIFSEELKPPTIYIYINNLSS